MSKAFVHRNSPQSEVPPSQLSQTSQPPVGHPDSNARTVNGWRWVAKPSGLAVTRLHRVLEGEVTSVECIGGRAVPKITTTKEEKCRRPQQQVVATRHGWSPGVLPSPGLERGG